MLKRSPVAREFVEQGYDLVIGDGYLEKPICSDIQYKDIETNVVIRKQKNRKAPKNGLYCKNFQDFLVEPEKIKYTEMANFLRPAIKQPIFNKEKINIQNKNKKMV